MTLPVGVPKQGSDPNYLTPNCKSFDRVHCTYCHWLLLADIHSKSDPSVIPNDSYLTTAFAAVFWRAATRFTICSMPSPWSTESVK